MNIIVPVSNRIILLKFLIGLLSVCPGPLQLPHLILFLLHTGGGPVLLPGGGWTRGRHVARLLPHRGGRPPVIHRGHEVLDQPGEVTIRRVCIALGVNDVSDNVVISKNLDKFSDR